MFLISRGPRFQGARLDSLAHGHRSSFLSIPTCFSPWCPGARQLPRPIYKQQCLLQLWFFSLINIQSININIHINAYKVQQKSMLSIGTIAATTWLLYWHSEKLILPKSTQILRNTTGIETYISEEQNTWSYYYNTLSLSFHFNRCLFWHKNIPCNMKAMFTSGYPWQRSSI